MKEEIFFIVLVSEVYEGLNLSYNLCRLNILESNTYWYVLCYASFEDASFVNRMYVAYITMNNII